jgi:hypothetical protein
MTTKKTFCIYHKIATDGSYQVIKSDTKQITTCKDYMDIDKVHKHKFNIDDKYYINSFVEVCTLKYDDDGIILNWVEKVKVKTTHDEHIKQVNQALTEYLDIFEKECAEINSFFKLNKYPFESWYSNQLAVRNVFTFISQNIIEYDAYKNKKFVENKLFKEVYNNPEYGITYEESEFMNDCYNGGLIHCISQDEPIDSHSYDLNMAYAKALGDSDMMIPIRPGFIREA